MLLALPSYDDLQHRVRELEDLVRAVREGAVDTVVSQNEPKQLLVLREFELERKRDRQLEELQAIVENLPTALAILWGDGQIQIANRAFCDVSEHAEPASLEQWAGGLSAAPPHLLDRLHEHLSETLKTGECSGSLELSFTSSATTENAVGHAGATEWVVCFQRLPGEVRGHPAALLAGVDVTQQKRLILELSDAKSQMEDFLAAASHDLKAPSITILHNLNFARISLGMAIPPETAHCLDRIAAAAQDMLTLLSQVSAVSRAGRDTEPRQRHPVRDLVAAALRQLEATLVQRSAKVVTAESWPELYCQKTKLIQLFANLISNAVKYTTAERTPRIEIGCARAFPGADPCFFVRDNGIGIPKEKLGQVFELFHRLSGDPQVPGQGVGLTIVKRIVELHGGRIWVDSVPGKGSTFYFTIPQRRENQHEHDS